MAIDFDSEAGRWFKRLARELHDRRTGRVGRKTWTAARSGVNPGRVRPPLEVLEDYRQGDPPLRPDIHAGWKPYIRRFVRMGRLNMADLVITSTSNRLKLRDFRTSAANDELGDREARKIIRASGLKVVSRDVHELALTMGEAYTLITPPGGTRKHPLITAEDPRQMIVAHDPATGEPLAGLKLVRSDWDDEDLAYLYFDGQVMLARRKGGTILTRGPHRLNPTSWNWDEDKFEDVPGGAFPVVTFRNRDGIGEFERHLDTLDRINDKIFDEWWIAKIQAFRQRAVKNLPDTKDEEQDDGTVKEVPVAEDEYDDMFTASPDEMWQVPADVDFWESTPVDMTPVTNAIEKDRARLASSTSTPLHTITPDAAQGSASGAELLREEHTAKCEDRLDRFDHSWAKSMSLAFAFAGDEARADLAQIESMWAPILKYTLTDRAQAASQAVSTLPLEIIQRDIWQYEPAEVQEIARMRGRELLLGGGQPPTPTPAPTPAPEDGPDQPPAG